MTRNINVPVDVEVLAMIIAHSQIVVKAAIGRDDRRIYRLPAGYDETDIAVLDWIVGEGRHSGRALRIM
jgi:hypothetical protein